NRYPIGIKCYKDPRDRGLELNTWTNLHIAVKPLYSVSVLSSLREKVDLSEKRKKKREEEEDEEEGLVRRGRRGGRGYAASDNEVDPYLESTAGVNLSGINRDTRAYFKKAQYFSSSDKLEMDLTELRQQFWETAKTPDIADIHRHKQIQNIIPQIVTRDVLTRRSWLVIPETMMEKEANSEVGELLSEWTGLSLRRCLWKSFVKVMKWRSCRMNSGIILWLVDNHKANEQTQPTQIHSAILKGWEILTVDEAWYVWYTDVRSSGRNEGSGRKQLPSRNGGPVDALQDPVNCYDYGNFLFNMILCYCVKSTSRGIEVANDLIPVGAHRKFDVIVGMDWLSKNKAERVCHEKVVRIPLEGGEILHVQGRLPLGGTKTP
ncbi:hypothetical protein Tco_1393181, partial [Tanacetum coccineum]